MRLTEAVLNVNHKNLNLLEQEVTYTFKDVIDI